jgi:hypothetical protein
MARSEGYLGSKIDQKTHPRNQNQVHRAATSFLAGETVGFCADAHAGPKKKTSELVIGVGSGTLGARAALTALKKGAYLK